MRNFTEPMNFDNAQAIADTLFTHAEADSRVPASRDAARNLLRRSRELAKPAAIFTLFCSG